jgi:hypothetical protein
VYYSASGRVATLSYIIFFYVRVRVRYVPGERKILLDEKKGMNELLLMAPLYLEVNNLRIFEPFYFTFVRARFLFNMRKDQKERKKNSPDFFLFS